MSRRLLAGLALCAALAGRAVAGPETDSDAACNCGPDHEPDPDADGCECRQVDRVGLCSASAPGRSLR